MRTLGIDLASQDDNTASCWIDWQADLARVSTPRVGRSNEELSKEISAADAVAIDAPFGWPDPFVEAVGEYAHGRPWPYRWPDREALTRLRLRLTDEVVGARTRVPLSVSSERIAVCAFRCAALLSQISVGPIDRIGSSWRFEVYPAGALRVWGLDARGYKKQEAVRRRSQLLEAIEAAMGGSLCVSASARERCVRFDHALDALVCALVGRAAACKLTTPPPEGAARERVEREGWIHLPLEGSLEKLARAV